MTYPSCIPAVRSQIEQAEEKLQIAAKLLRENGQPFPDHEGAER